MVVIRVPRFTIIRTTREIHLDWHSLSMFFYRRWMAKYASKGDYLSKSLWLKLCFFCNGKSRAARNKREALKASNGV